MFGSGLASNLRDRRSFVAVFRAIRLGLRHALRPTLQGRFAERTGGGFYAEQIAAQSQSSTASGLGGGFESFSVFNILRRSTVKSESEDHLNREPFIGRRVYAVGDVHGRLDLLRCLCDRIALDRRSGGIATPTTIVFLGDLIDRGPNSAGVVSYVMRLARTWPVEIVTIKGNHEQCLLDFLRDPHFGRLWIRQGGRETLASYGVSTHQGSDGDIDWQSVRDKLYLAIPKAHFRFLSELPSSYVVDDYFFAHAGIRPGVALEDQNEQDLLWIRDEFLNTTKHGSHVVVHGHTPCEAPQVTRWRIGLDTGAYATGVLSAIKLEGVSRSIIQVRATPAASCPAKSIA